MVGLLVAGQLRAAAPGKVLLHCLCTVFDLSASAKGVGEGLRVRRAALATQV